MAQIFISYARHDRTAAQALAEALEKRGWSVWWDADIPLGRSFDEVIETAIRAAGCVIVLWSRASVASDWVRSEASEGKRRGILVPVFIESVDAPLAFRLLNGADLADWQPGTPHPELDKLERRITEILNPQTSPKELVRVKGGEDSINVESDRPRVNRRWLTTAVLALLAVGLAFAAYQIGTRMARPSETSIQQPPDGPSPKTKASTGNINASARPGEGVPDAATATSGNESAAPPGASGVALGLDPTQMAMTVFQIPDLGLHIIFVSPEQGDVVGLPPGAVVWRVESGPAQAAGIHAGDGLIAVNGRRIASEDDLRRAITAIGPGKSRYLIRRSQQTLTIEINCPNCTPR